ncbi:hydroxyethylthiazole kinase [bacterium]|nr:hydroxyethylthiazole kinase [candidate division CSSED10-310 bacterium]
MRNWPKQGWQDIQSIRDTHPLIHNITNLVVMNWTANILLSMGASPVMAHSMEEVEEMVGFAGALVLNIGTLTPDWVQAMIAAGRAANARGVPVVLDPVGAGATRLRTASSHAIMAAVKLAVIRGNGAEILALAGDNAAIRGVDSLQDAEAAGAAAKRMAAELGTVLAITGRVDVVTDGRRLYRIANGHPMMTRVTGTGCAATAVTAAFCAVNPDFLAAAVEGLACFGVAGELAAARARGPGSFQVELLDALAEVDEDMLDTRLQVSDE